MKIDATIRKTTPDDWHLIYEVLLDAVERQKGGNPLLAWTEKTIQRENICNDFDVDCFYVAFVDEKPAACIAITDEHSHVYPEIEKGQCRFVRWFAVKRAFSKSGLSKQMLDFAKLQANSAQVPLRLETSRFNKKLCEFYKSQGFVPCGKFYDSTVPAHLQLFIYEN